MRAFAGPRSSSLIIATYAVIGDRCNARDSNSRTGCSMCTPARRGSEVHAPHDHCSMDSAGQYATALSMAILSEKRASYLPSPSPRRSPADATRCAPLRPARCTPPRTLADEHPCAVAMSRMTSMAAAARERAGPPPPGARMSMAPSPERERPARRRRSAARAHPAAGCNESESEVRASGTGE